MNFRSAPLQVQTILCWFLWFHIPSALQFQNISWIDARTGNSHAWNQLRAWHVRKPVLAYTKKRALKFSILQALLSYCYLVWAQNCNTIQWIVVLQKKAVRIIDFQQRNFHTSPLFKQNSILTPPALCISGNCIKMKIN